MERDFHNILVIHFGQLGDIVLGLPALRAIRERFADARITLAVGKAPADIANLAAIADDYIVVDRVALRDGNKLVSLIKIASIIRDIRRRRFDLVIDLLSYYETNLIGFLGGIPLRLYANRQNRSMDRLSNFRPRPPREDRSRHASQRYLDVLWPLGLELEASGVRLDPDPADIVEVQRLFAEHGVRGNSVVGMFPGSGHPSRRWPVEKFAALAHLLARRRDTSVVVFLGPEERDLIDLVQRTFPPTAVILDTLKLRPLFAALSQLNVLVSNDTGPAHLAAATAASIVLIVGEDSYEEFWPLTDRLTVVKSGPIATIDAEEVYRAVLAGLGNDNSAATC